MLSDSLKKKLSLLSIPLELLILWEFSNDAWCLKDMSGNIVYSNHQYSNLLKNEKNEMLSPLIFFQKEILEHDGSVIRELKKIDAIGISPTSSNSRFTIFCCEKTPYYNKQEELFGIISHIKPINSFTPRFFIFHEDIGELTVICPSSILSKKEWVIAFLLMHGAHEKEIASILNRTLRTVKFHKNNIFTKINCKNTKEFISYSRASFWLSYVPPLFLKPCYMIKPSATQ